jgi:hypothetical protein
MLSRGEFADSTQLGVPRVPRTWGPGNARLLLGAGSILSFQVGARRLAGTGSDAQVWPPPSIPLAPFRIGLTRQHFS